MSLLDNPGSSLSDGRKTVAAIGTAEKLSTSNARIVSVAITAETDNTGVITVGGSTVVGAVGTRRGTPLAAGQSMTLNVSQLSAIWLDTTVNGDGVTYTVIRP